ncbi:MAG: tetratricopeptide repeat protein [Nitrospirae bacterium]|nr:tetratricopeptide repeat protein [Nitrospirota bacterium]
MGNGFVLDDNQVILQNPVLQGAPLSLLSAIDTTSETQLLPFYRPFTYLTFLFEERVHGFNPILMHLLNILLHAANTFLVYRLAISFFKDSDAALLVSLLFAVHPLHTEGVNFLSGGRNTMLACFCVLTAYLLHHRSISLAKLSPALAGAAFYLAGLFSKEIGLMVPPLILVLEIATLRNSSCARLGAVWRLLPYVTATTCYFVMRWMTLSNLGIQTGFLPGFGTQKLEDLYVVPSLIERLINNLYIIPAYLLTTIWPVSLSSRYDIPADLHLLALPLTAAWIIIIAAIAWLFTRGRSRASLFGFFWLVLFWLPVSGIIYFSNIQMADRFLYIPAIGLWIIVADQVSHILPAGSSARRYGRVAALLILVALAALTASRNADWKNNISLYARMVEQYPVNAYGHAGLGSAYFDESGNDNRYLVSAERELEKALALSPAPAMFPAAHNQLGHIKQNRGDYEGALHHYNEALAIFPYDKETRINRGIVYEKLGRQKEALADYLFFLSIPGANNVPGSQAYAEERVRELERR